MGPRNQWQKLLPKDISNEIENKFKKEMKDLKYL